MSSAPLIPSSSLPVAGKRVRLPGFFGGGDALAISEIVAASNKPVIFIARDIPDAAHLLEETRFFAPALPINYLPDWDVLPYDIYSPTSEITAQRIIALTALLDNKPGLTITTSPAFLSSLPPPSFLAGRAFLLQVGDKINIAALLERLCCGGYMRVDRVLSAGEFAMYGGQVDIYPPNAAQPFRLVLLDDEVEQIRLFSAETQRSIERVETLRILPMSECDLSAAGVKYFRRAYLDAFGDASGDIYHGVSEGVLPSGGEFYLPLFFEESGRLFDYLNGDCLVITHHNMRETVARFLHQTRLRQKIVSVYENRPVLPSSFLFLSENDFYTRLRDFPLLELDAPQGGKPPQVLVNQRIADSHRALITFLSTCEERVIIAVDSKGRCDSLKTALQSERIQATVCETYADCFTQKLSLVVASLRGGYSVPGLTVLTEAELFGVSLPPRAQRKSRGGDMVIHPGDIATGELVVHREYGVGRALGLKNITVGNQVGEFFEIEYVDEQRLFLPVSQLHLLERHHGGVELSKMGSARWHKTRKGAEKRAHDTAAQLLDINARRAASNADGRKADAALMAKFIGAFAYPATPDQERAAEETLADIAAAKPMDRLVTADVGFGKTEVAMRAAAAVAFCGAQVAMLAPTTLLAEQHQQTFTDRFADFPVRVACLTRLTSAHERRQTLAGLAAGDTDIVIGTHALLSKSVSYANLGLAIIDEEHRFGVRHKEQFKKMRANVDLLSLSATPIPRTLAMAFGGIRDISVITTPPVGRLSVKSIVAPFSHAVAVEACERELLRGGQIFFVHNEIRTMPEMLEKINQWLPRARVITAHGGMNAPELEGAMRLFVRHEADILLCTTIVESGLDIANANTIIINRADKMGLSRLHQLRGRVGRSGVQAYAYFLTPEDYDPPAKGDARLAAIREYAALGGGFFLSMRDLEIRGAGEILGVKQSGDMEAVGCAMYQRMVNAAAKRLKGEPEVEQDTSVTINLSAAALLPSEYIASPSERLYYYRRLSAAKDGETVRTVAAEWQDRFGALPAPAVLLAESHHLRLLAAAAAVDQISIGSSEATVQFLPDPACADKLLQKITGGACRPTIKNAVKLPLITNEPLAQARQVSAFLGDLI